MSNKLGGINVLVTRPAQRGRELCERIVQLGGAAVHLPVIEFGEPENKALFRESIQSLGAQNWLIFVSPQAVAASVPAIRAAWPNFPATVNFAAIGEGTAAALKAAGYVAAICPTGPWSTEGLLAMPAFQSVANQKIAIIRGEGGREALAAALSERGAEVSHVIAYSRQLPVIDMAPYLELVQQHQLDVLVCTSFESVSHLKTLFGDKGYPFIRKLPLIVVSERIKILAEDLGFQTIWVAENASHEAILAMLEQKRKALCQSKPMK